MTGLGYLGSKYNPAITTTVKIQPGNPLVATKPIRLHTTIFVDVYRLFNCSYKIKTLLGGLIIAEQTVNVRGLKVHLRH